MRILALSDVTNWDGYKGLLDRCRPDIVALGGDLTSDGVAVFWRDALEKVPGFMRARDNFRRRYSFIHNGRTCRLKVSGRPPAGKQSKPFRDMHEFREHEAELEARYRRTRAFLAARKRMHVDKFYEFLRYAGGRCQVLVVKGDHDDDFQDDYEPRRIDEIPNCREISGKTFTFGEWTFLGLGFQQAGYRRALRSIIASFKGQVKIVVAHAPQKNLPLIMQLHPQLLIRGHYGSGHGLIEGIHVAFTSHQHALIEVRRTGVVRIMGCKNVNTGRTTLDPPAPFLR